MDGTGRKRHAGLVGRLRERELYVTLKAVEAHLARAYTKLGIDGRSQLARALAAGKE